MGVKEKYKELTDREHVLLRPGMYIGATTPETTEFSVFNSKASRHEFRTDSLSPALLKMFDEILSNSIDESKRKGSQLNEINVVFDIETGAVSIHDNGGIPVEEYSEGVYVPELCFSRLRAGSNFDDTDKRTGVGTNGLGSTLVNIFSTVFKVETCDKEKIYIKEWRDNMATSSEPVITRCKDHYTTITYTPDYSRLDADWKAKAESYMYIYKERCEQAAISSEGLKITFNGEHLDWTFDKYVKSFDPDAIDLCSNLKTYFKNTGNKETPWSICVGSSGRDISMVNGSITRSGGSHVRYIKDRIVKAVQTNLSQKKIVIPDNIISSNISLYISATVINPTYSSQTKEKLTSPASSFVGAPDTMPTTVARDICKTDIINRIIESYESKIAKQLAKQAAASSINIPKLIDLPSVKFFEEPRELWIFEGDSAADGFYHSRKNNQGCLPIRGKIVNCYELTKSQAVKNQEVHDIFLALGILDKKDDEIFTYSNSGLVKLQLADGEIDVHEDSEIIYNEKAYTLKDFRKLSKTNEISVGEILEKRLVTGHCMRYDNVVISSDADIDGDAICGLLLNLFHKYYPSLLTQGRVFRAITPLLTCKYKNGKAKDVLTFYSLDEFNVFATKKENKDLISDVQYKKGLGSLKDDEFKDMMHNTHRKYFYALNDTAFEEWWGKDTDARKRYIAGM